MKAEGVLVSATWGPYGLGFQFHSVSIPGLDQALKKKKKDKPSISYCLMYLPRVSHIGCCVRYLEVFYSELKVVLRFMMSPRVSLGTAHLLQYLCPIFLFVTVSYSDVIQ